MCGPLREHEPVRMAVDIRSWVGTVAGMSP